jgi:uncharacterized protein (DUF849 family)
LIVQACINGARPHAFHLALPLTPDAMARDSASCIAAGAAEIHLHTRGPDLRESLAPTAMDATLLAVRRRCPGALIGVSTGAWIEPSERDTIAAIDAWNELPDYASVNLEEPAAPAVIARLRQRGVAVELGLASVVDADRMVSLNLASHALRILLEVSEQDSDKAVAVEGDIEAVLDRAGVRKPMLLHGFDSTVWDFVSLAAKRHWSTRVGLEDGRTLPDGTVASDNAALVAAAMNRFGTTPPPAPPAPQPPGRSVPG